MFTRICKPRHLGAAGLLAIVALVLGLTAAPAFAEPTFEGTFGAKEIEPVASGDAVDTSSSASAGDIYVANENSNIVKFNSANAKVGEITSANAEECTGASGLVRTFAVAVNSANGDVYVADQGTGRVTAFGPEGHCIWQSAELGGGEGVAVDPGLGLVYVTIRAKASITKLNATTGATEGEIGEGKLGGGLGLAVNPTTHDIFAVNEGAEVIAFESNGTCMNSCASLSTAKPMGVAVDAATGHLFVAENEGEPENVQISEYEVEGSGAAKFVESFGKGHFGNATVTFGLAVGNGKLYAADFQPKEISVFSLGAPPPTEPELTVTKEGKGSGTVTSSPAGINCGTECKVKFGKEGEKVILTEAPAEGSTFGGWTGCTAISATECEVTVTGNTTVKATFSLPSVTLKVTESAEGEVTGTGGIACGVTCSASIEETAPVTLEAHPAGGFKFKEWTGVTCEGGQTSATCKFAMPSTETTATATYEVTKTSPLSVFVVGKGEVNSNPAGITACTETSGVCTAEFEGMVTLEAKAEPGSMFAGWIGPCKHATETTCQVEVSSAREVYAVFLLEGKTGPEGPQGEKGAEGKTGPQGPAGAKGAEGKAGPQGPQGTPGTNGENGKEGPAGKAGANGATGPAGPQGPAGPRGPAGKVTCKVHQKGKKVKVTCVVKASKASAARVHWLLSRGGHAVSHGVTRDGHVRLAESGLPAGRYTLTLISGSGSHKTVRSESFTLR